jgi:hypothetical protein
MSKFATGLLPLPPGKGWGEGALRDGVVNGVTARCPHPNPLPRGEGTRTASMCMVAGSLLVATCATAFAQDNATIDRTQIIGNRELPKVLYIVPWKKPLPGDLSGRPLVSVLDEAMAPVDRDVFRRQVSYDGQVQAQAKAATTATAATTAPAVAAQPAATTTTK